MTQKHSEVRRRVSPTESVSYAIIDAVATVKDVSPLELPPLQDVIDTDALNQLFAPRANGLSRTGGCLSFSLANCEVMLQSNDVITVTEVKDSTPTVVPTGATDIAPQGAGRSD